MKLIGASAYTYAPRKEEKKNVLCDYLHATTFFDSLALQKRDTCGTEWKTVVLETDSFIYGKDMHISVSRAPNGNIGIHPGTVDPVMIVHETDQITLDFVPMQSVEWSTYDTTAMTNIINCFLPEFICVCVDMFVTKKVTMYIHTCWVKDRVYHVKNKIRFNHIVLDAYNTTSTENFITATLNDERARYAEAVSGYNEFVAWMVARNKFGPDPDQDKLRNYAKLEGGEAFCLLKAGVSYWPRLRIWLQETLYLEALDRRHPEKNLQRIVHKEMDCYDVDHIGFVSREDADKTIRGMVTAYKLGIYN